MEQGSAVTVKGGGGRGGRMAGGRGGAGSDRARLGSARVRSAPAQCRGPSVGSVQFGRLAVALQSRGVPAAVPPCPVPVRRRRWITPDPLQIRPPLDPRWTGHTSTARHRGKTIGLVGRYVIFIEAFFSLKNSFLDFGDLWRLNRWPWVKSDETLVMANLIIFRMPFSDLP